jgi:hypothetical protein
MVSVSFEGVNKKIGKRKESGSGMLAQTHLNLVRYV